MRAVVLALLVATAAGAQGYQPAHSSQQLTRADGQLSTADTDIMPRGVVAQAGSGEYAFKALHFGAKWKFGAAPNQNDECYVGTDGVLYCGIIFLAQLGVDALNPKTLDGRPIPVTLGVLLNASALQTCGGALAGEGTIRWDNTSGASTGQATRLCVCTSDGAGTFKWRNLFSTSTSGTTTTCPN